MKKADATIYPVTGKPEVRNVDPKTGKPKKVAFSDEQTQVANMFGNNPEDVYGSPSDSQELPASAAGDAIEGNEEQTGKDDEKDLTAQLKAIADNPDTKEADKKQANELIARLQELEQAEKNAEDFLNKNGGATTAPADNSMTTSAQPAV